MPVIDWVSIPIFLQSLRTEVDNHEPRIHLVCDNGAKLINEGHEDSEEFSQLIEELLEAWQGLKDAMENRKKNLLVSERAQQVCVMQDNNLKT